MSWYLYRVCEGAAFVLWLNNADAHVSVYSKTAALFVLQTEQVWRGQTLERAACKPVHEFTVLSEQQAKHPFKCRGHAAAGVLNN